MDLLTQLRGVQPPRLRYICAVFVLVLAVLIAQIIQERQHSPDSLVGSVVYARAVQVFQGDLFTAVIDGTNQLALIHIDGVAAPSLEQPHGTRSAEHLSTLLGVGREEPTRLICSLKSKSVSGYFFAGVAIHVGRHQNDTQFLYLNEHLVASGLAWARKGLPASSPLIRLQESAKEARRGLWEREDPIPPWKARKRKSRLYP